MIKRNTLSATASFLLTCGAFLSGGRADAQGLADLAPPLVVSDPTCTRFVQLADFKAGVGANGAQSAQASHAARLGLLTRLVGAALPPIPGGGRTDNAIDLQKLGLTPPIIKRINTELPLKTNELATLKREQQLINVELVKKSGELNAILYPKGAVVLPPGLIGKVSAVDPKWDFVVLDIGANHGLLRNGELSISREGKLIARVKVAKVETDYAIANVMPGFKKSEIREGDAVLTPSSTYLPSQK